MMEGEQRQYTSTGSDENFKLLLPPTTPLSLPQKDWNTPLVEHHFVTDDHESSAPHYPSRDRRPPDRYQP